MPASQLGELAEQRVLGIQQIGAQLAPAFNRAPINRTPINRTPTQNISMSIFHPEANALCDVWLANTPCAYEQIGDIHVSFNAQVLFGVIEVDEKNFADPAFTQPAVDSPLRAATDAAYQQIFSLLKTKNYPHLWRAWNYIPDIHGAEAGLERYRQFNIGRHHAFEAARCATDASPAASALGTRDGKFSIAFIAGHIAPTRIENPRQISAYAYPAQYGPRSPAFSRAITVATAHHYLLFVSGTASIVGHETVHSGDVVAQTREAVANVSALLEQAHIAATLPLSAPPLSALTYRVYIRHRHHAALVQQALEALIDVSAHALYLQADICREDLLVEIEAFAVLPIDTQPTDTTQ